MKYFVFITLPFALLISCSAPTADVDAKSVCECYKKASREKPERADIVADSCTQLYKKVLTDLKGDEEGKKKFVAAFDYCRNN